MKNSTKPSYPFNIEHLVKSYSAVESKTLLWKLFKTAVVNNKKVLDKAELKELAVFYEKLNKALDDIY